MYLNKAGLEWLIEHDTETYKKLCEKYLSKRSKNLNLNIEKQNWYVRNRYVKETSGF